jgi:hypothetical protein
VLIWLTDSVRALPDPRLASFVASGALLIAISVVIGSALAWFPRPREMTPPPVVATKPALSKPTGVVALAWQPGRD